MLYKVGMLIALLSAAFAGGSPLIPAVLALTGAGLMWLGREGRHDDGETR